MGFDTGTMVMTGSGGGFDTGTMVMTGGAGSKMGNSEGKVQEVGEEKIAQYYTKRQEEDQALSKLDGEYILITSLSFRAHHR